MLSHGQKHEIRCLIERSLDEAQQAWDKSGHVLEKSLSTEAYRNRSFAEDSVPSRLPGHPVVEPSLAKTSDFIAIVADMRESTKHLLEDISEKRATITRIQRIFYETSALLPALERTIQFENGKVTEYLGDGVLGFFNADDDAQADAIYSASRAAQNCVEDTRAILNEILNDRYNLPDVSLGVGLAFSPCLISALGMEGNKHPKAFGRCVYDATKLSHGWNEVYVQEYLSNIWPAARSGQKAVVSFGKIVEKGSAKGRKLTRNPL